MQVHQQRAWAELGLHTLHERILRLETLKEVDEMARTYSNRTNGQHGAQASRWSRVVSRDLRRLGYRPNGRSADLDGLTCRQVGNVVFVRANIHGHLDDPALRGLEAACLAEIADKLLDLGYTVEKVHERDTATLRRLMISKSHWR